jgi:hypothetical protein
VRDGFGGTGGAIVVTSSGQVVAQRTTAVMPHAVGRAGHVLTGT